MLVAVTMDSGSTVRTDGLTKADLSRGERQVFPCAQPTLTVYHGCMAEAGWALGVLLLVGGITAAELLGFADLVMLGQQVMLTSAALGIPLELVYYALLAVALTRAGARPEGWYWRPFAHHHLLGARARWLILPIFYLGALAFLGIVVGIALVLLAFVVAAREG